MASSNPTASPGRIDTHFHALPPAFVTALTEAGDDPSGYTTPEWTLDGALHAMQTLGTSTAILSVSAPGVSIAGTGDAARILCRKLNAELAGYAQSHPDRLGFFGALPDWCDVQGVLDELDVLYGEQKQGRPRCAGVMVFTSYGGKLLGDELFVRIWERLERYKALIFIHPGMLDVTPKFIAGALPQPIVDYPLATTRTAVDLVATGTLQRCHSVDIILSHAGGVLPFIGFRAVLGLEMPAMAGKLGALDASRVREDFGRFYYDIALSTSAAQLNGLLDWTTPDKVVFGSDYPYVPLPGISGLVGQYEQFVEKNPRGKMLAPDVLRRNSGRLLQKHGFTVKEQSSDTGT